MSDERREVVYRSLMVPLDGSTFAEYALSIALGIARRSGASVQVVTVAPHPALFSGRSTAELVSTWHDYLHGVVERAQSVAGPGVSLSSQVLQDTDVAATLCAHTRDAAIDLVVMSTHGRGTLGRFWFGSVAYKVLHRCSVPILYVKPGTSVAEQPQELALQHLLVMLDGTPQAERVLTPALAFGALMGADYSLLRVVPDVAYGGSPELDSNSLCSATLELLDEIHSVQERLRKEAQDYLDGVAVRLRSRGLQVQAQVMVDRDLGTAILDALAATGIDLVALETHGLPDPTGHLGNVARKVIHGTSKPVFVHSVGAERSNNP